MRDNGILDTIHTLIGTDPACLDRDAIRDVMNKIRHVQGWASAGLLECTRRLEELSTASNPGADASFTLAGAMDQSSAEANSTVGQAQLCNTNTELEDSLAAGEITARHLALIAKYRSRLEAHERSDFDLEIPRIHRWAREQHFKMFEQSIKDLVMQIRHRHHPVDEMAELERQRNASKLKSWVEDSTGLHNFLLSMDPVRAAKFTSAYQAELAALRATKQDRREPFGSLMIQAVINALGARCVADTGANGSNTASRSIQSQATDTDSPATGNTTGTTATDNTPTSRNMAADPNNSVGETLDPAAGQPGVDAPGQATSRSSELIVVVDHRTLVAGRHDGTVCETVDGSPLPVPFVRELCQDAIISLFALDQYGNILNAIDERTANRTQRRALAAMYRSCSFPNCTVPFSQTRMHHIHYSRDGGKTQLCNLIPLCETHHHHIHDLGWSLTMDATTRQATFTEPHSRDGIRVCSALVAGPHDLQPRRDDQTSPGVHQTWPDRQRSLPEPAPPEPASRQRREPPLIAGRRSDRSGGAEADEDHSHGVDQHNNPHTSSANEPN